MNYFGTDIEGPVLFLSALGMALNYALYTQVEFFKSKIIIADELNDEINFQNIKIEDEINTAINNLIEIYLNPLIKKELVKIPKFENYSDGDLFIIIDNNKHYLFIIIKKNLSELQTQLPCEENLNYVNLKYRKENLKREIFSIKTNISNRLFLITKNISLRYTDDFDLEIKLSKFSNK